MDILVRSGLLLSHQGGTGRIDVLDPEEGGNRARVRTIDDLIKLYCSTDQSLPAGAGVLVL